MYDSSLAASRFSPAAMIARQDGATGLAQGLEDSRRDTLELFGTCEAALPGPQTPLRAELNPSLSELGHIAWFQGYWLMRFPVWRQGVSVDTDALYDVSHVPYDSRLAFPLPDADTTRVDLAPQLKATLALLGELQHVGPSRDDGLHFFRLALLHENMHHEATPCMAQGLGVAIDDLSWQARALPAVQRRRQRLRARQRIEAPQGRAEGHPDRCPGTALARVSALRRGWRLRPGALVKRGGPAVAPDQRRHRAALPAPGRNRTLP